MVAEISPIGTDGEGIAPSLNTGSEGNVEVALTTTADLAKRFAVSMKTIARWKKLPEKEHPLVGTRVIRNNHKTVVFTADAVERFQQANGERVRRAAGFSRTTLKEQAAIVRQANVLAETNGYTRADIIHRVSQTSGRTLETIRAILAKHTEIFPNDPIARIMNESKKHRLSRIMELPLDFIPNDSFAKIRPGKKREQGILGPMPQCDVPQKKAKVPGGLPPYLASVYEGDPLLTREQEVHLFRKMNYLKFKACRLRESLDPQHPQTAVMDQIEELFGAMTAIRNEIVQANLRLVVSIAKRYVNRANPDDLFEKCSDGNISLMRAAEKFDYARGNKFSTYASWAIMKNFARTIPTEQRHQSREQSGCADGLLGETIIDDRADPEASERAQMVRETKIELLLERLDEREQKIIRARFGLPPYKEPMTLKLVGAEMGVTKERVRQIEARALVKLRTAAREEGITLESVLGDLAVFSSD